MHFAVEFGEFRALDSWIFVRLVVTSTTLLTLGSHVALGTFFLSIFNLQRRKLPLISTVTPGNTRRFSRRAVMQPGRIFHTFRRRNGRATPANGGELLAALKA
jgi:hypothetical protein